LKALLGYWTTAGPSGRPRKLMTADVNAILGIIEDDYDTYWDDLRDKMWLYPT